MTDISKYIKPIGWTRQSNLDGFLKGTYDVIALWPRGPEKEVWSNVAFYTEEQVLELIEKLKEENDLR